MLGLLAGWVQVAGYLETRLPCVDSARLVGHLVSRYAGSDWTSSTSATDRAASFFIGKSEAIRPNPRGFCLLVAGFLLLLAFLQMVLVASKLLWLAHGVSQKPLIPYWRIRAF